MEGIDEWIGLSGIKVEGIKPENPCGRTLLITYPIHHKRLKEIWNTERLQIDEFMSYQIGLMKPNDEAFEYMVRKLGIAKSEILFIDDSQKSVESAVRNGLNAYLFKNNEDLEIIKNLLYQQKSNPYKTDS